MKRFIPFILAALILFQTGCGNMNSTAPGTSQPTQSIAAESPSTEPTDAPVQESDPVVPSDTPPSEPEVPPSPSPSPSEPTATPDEAPSPEPSESPSVVPDEPVEPSDAPSTDPVEPPAPQPEPSETPAASPTPTPSTAPAPSPKPSTTPTVSAAEKILNGATLFPMKTNDEALDAMVADILSRITTDSMSTYEKVKACYEYLIQNTVYATSTEPTVLRSGVYTSMEDYKSVLLATEVLSTGKGVCDHYAAALHVLTRRIGLESYLCGGKYIDQRGNGTGHVWTIITINGTDYIFDAQIEDTVHTTSLYFCKTFAEMGNRYQNYDIAQSKSEFCHFQRESTSSSSGSSSNLMKAIFDDHPELYDFADYSIWYSEEAAMEASFLRAEYGLPEMSSDVFAAIAACCCAMYMTQGEEVTTETAGNLMYEFGVDFRYVVMIPLGEYADPAEIVRNNPEAFTNPDFWGFSAGCYDDFWVILFYGG